MLTVILNCVFRDRTDFGKLSLIPLRPEHLLKQISAIEWRAFERASGLSANCISGNLCTLV